MNEKITLNYHKEFSKERTAVYNFFQVMSPMAKPSWHSDSENNFLGTFIPKYEVEEVKPLQKNSQLTMINSFYFSEYKEKEANYRSILSGKHLNTKQNYIAMGISVATLASFMYGATGHIEWLFGSALVGMPLSLALLRPGFRKDQDLERMIRGSEFYINREYVPEARKYVKSLKYNPPEKTKQVNEELMRIYKKQ